jgi:hypothetical protein
MSCPRRLPPADVHLHLPTDSATPLPHATDGEHCRTSLYLTEVSQLATLAHSGHPLSSGKPRHYQWTPGQQWTGILAALLGLQHFPLKNKYENSKKRRSYKSYATLGE